MTLSLSHARPAKLATAAALMMCLANVDPVRAGTAIESSSVHRSSSRHRRRLRQRSLPVAEAALQDKPSSFSAAAESQPNRPRNLAVSARIVNGQEAKGSQDFPFFVQWFRGCGGSLIAPDIVLTAAHCYDDNYREHLLRLEGDSNNGKEQKFYNVLDAHVHPQFNQENNLVNNNEYDFMVLRLKDPLPHIRPIALHSEASFPLQDKEDLTIVGYGLTEEEGTASTSLQRATVQYHQDCRWANYRPGRVATDTMFCAHGVEERYHPKNDTTTTTIVDSCQGDSGGPILRKTPQGWQQVGVTSWGVGCARPDAPGIYARTKATYDWILQQVCAMSQVPPPSCSNPVLQEQNNNNGEDVFSPEELTELSAYVPGTILSEGVTEEMSVPSNAPNSTITTLPQVTTITITTLRVNIHYDDYPQEISWALAKHPATTDNNDNDEQFSLLYISPRQPTSVRNQLVSQDVLDVTVGQYRLEVYDTIAGDGIQPQGSQQQRSDPPIELWQINTVIKTSLHWNEAANATVAVVDDSQTTSQLLWSHAGDFGELVRHDVQVDAAAMGT